MTLFWFSLTDLKFVGILFAMAEGTEQLMHATVTRSRYTFQAAEDRAHLPDHAYENFPQLPCPVGFFAISSRSWDGLASLR